MDEVTSGPTSLFNLTKPEAEVEIRDIEDRKDIAEKMLELINFDLKKDEKSQFYFSD